MPKDVFISYAKDDRTWAELVCAQLEEAGVTCWIAPRDIAPGVTWPAAITEAIDHCRAMIIVFSRHANQSPHMAREIECADTRRVPILPVRVENVTPAGDMEYFLGNRQWFDLHERTIERRINGLPEAIAGLLAGADIRGPVAAGAAIRPPEKRKGRGIQRWLLGAGACVAVLGAIVVYSWPPKPAPAQHQAENVAPATSSNPIAAPAPPVVADPRPAQIPAGKKDSRQTAPPTVPPSAPVHTAKITEPPPMKAPANPASLSGKWEALVKYSWGDSHKEIFNFKVDENELLGTASYVGGPRGILDGKIEGTKVTFTTKSMTALGDKTYEEKHNYRGRLSGDTIEFMLQTESGYDSRPPETFTAKRVEPAKPQPDQ